VSLNPLDVLTVMGDALLAIEDFSVRHSMQTLVSQVSCIILVFT